MPFTRIEKAQSKRKGVMCEVISVRRKKEVKHGNITKTVYEEALEKPKPKPKKKAVKKPAVKKAKK